MKTAWIIWKSLNFFAIKNLLRKIDHIEKTDISI